MKRHKSVISAIPSKRFYRSIIADYGLETAVAELVDNVIDSRLRRNFSRRVSIKVSIDCDSQEIEICDDGGGIHESDLTKLVSPGSSHTDGQSTTIGVFGVGSKRAAVALARDIKIFTRFRDDPKAFLVEYDDNWLKDEDWDLPYYEVDLIPKNSTRIVLSRLRFVVDEGYCRSLKAHLSKTYATFIHRGDIEIHLNQDIVTSKFYDTWAFPTDAAPVSFEKRLIPSGKNLPILFRITSGLTWEQGSIGGDYGVYVYCNDRLVVCNSRDGEFGFLSGIAGVPHPRMSNARVIIEFKGGALELPWNSSKTGLNYNHDVFRAVREDIQTAVKNSTSLSKRLQPDFENSVAPYKEGSVACHKLKSEERLKPSKLPVIPAAKLSIQNAIKEANREVERSKPWTTGAFESVIAVETIRKQRSLKQRNRIALIVVDSSLEIAFKDYLAYELKQPLGDDSLQKLFKNRIEVHKKVRETIFTNDDGLWNNVSYLYRLRCELVHKRASGEIDDEDIEKFQAVAEKLFRKMFGLSFPKV